MVCTTYQLKCLSLSCLLLAIGLVLVTRPAFAHQLQDRHLSHRQCDKLHITEIPKRKPYPKYTGQLKTPVKLQDQDWVCSFFNCEKQPLSTMTRRPDNKQGNGHTAPRKTKPLLTPPSMRREVLPPHDQEHNRQPHLSQSHIAVTDIDADIKKLIITLLKKHQLSHLRQERLDDNNAHCQEMMKGIALKIYQSQNRKSLSSQTRELAMDMRYFCRKKHFSKAYENYQDLLKMIGQSRPIKKPLK